MIMKKKDDFDLLKESLGEVLDHVKGKITLKTTAIRMPDPAPKMSGKEIAQIRKKCRMSQAVFARTLNVSKETEAKWEQGLRNPNGAALRLLQVIRKKPEIAVNF